MYQRKKPRLAHQLMGNLPADQVYRSCPFLVSGLVYAGSMQVRASSGRGIKTTKGYTSLFVCFSTRAVHLELVSDLTSEKFLLAFKRFVGRRGICQHLYSDNATTFHGADQELIHNFKSSSRFYGEVAATLANNGTEWTFIPPNALHYGGLWEVGVKSTKHHLRRLVGKHTLIVEELSTVFVEIEACLNSRSLSPMSNHINDLRALTPAHFLIGESSFLLLEEPQQSEPKNRLERFRSMSWLRNKFWTR